MREIVFHGWELGLFAGGLLGPVLGFALSASLGLPTGASVVGTGTLGAFAGAILADGFGAIVVEIDN